MWNFILEILDRWFAGGSLLAIVPMLVGAASSIGNGLFGGLSANRQKEKQLRAINEAKRRNRNWFDRRFNESLTDRADVMRLIGKANESIKARNRAAAGRKRVVGGTDASLAATQENNAKAMGDAVSTAAADVAKRKDGIEASYRQRDEELSAQAANVVANAEASKRAAVAQAATGAVKTAAAMLANGEDGGEKAAGDVTKGPDGVEEKIDNNAITTMASKSLDDGLKSYKSLDDYWQNGY